MISYFLNWMGPVSTTWYTDRGLDYNDPQQRYCCGRVDVTVPGEFFPEELGVPLMLQHSWVELRKFLDNLHTEEVLTLDELVAQFEQQSGEKVVWYEQDS